MPLILTESDVRALLPMPDLIAAMARALDEYSAGRVAQPVRTVLEVGPERAFLGVMPAALDAPAVAGAKLVTVYHRNHERGLPSHLATIVLLDHATGALQAIVDGRYITEARTGAVSAVSVDRLARVDADTLAILGSGVQARSHLEAIRHVRRLTDVRVWSPNADRCAAFAREATDRTGLPVRAAPTAAAAARDAAIVVLATAAKTPVIDDAAIAPGTHIAAVGACRPDEREMPTALVARARVIVDSRAGALQEAGDLLLPIREGAISAAHLAAELGDVVGRRADGRVSPEEVTIFKSLGMAVEDVVAAHLVLDRAAAAGRGLPFSLT